jgi:hypothetical protein
VRSKAISLLKIRNPYRKGCNSQESRDTMALSLVLGCILEVQYVDTGATKKRGRANFDSAYAL